MKSSTITFIVSILIIIVGVVVIAVTSTQPSKYEDFAQCLADNDVTFYGAYWCPNCIDQKRLFDDAKTLPYVECANPDRSTNELCTAAGIEAYPTWEFGKGGEKITGTQPLELFAAATGCELPESHESNLDITEGDNSSAAIPDEEA